MVWIIIYILLQVQNWFCNKRHYNKKQAQKASQQVLIAEDSVERTDSDSTPIVQGA